MKKQSSLIFPEVVNNFRVYNKGDAYQGITGEVSMPEISAMTATISGAGMLGEYETNVIGMFSNITQEIPFRMINEEFFDLIKANEQAELTLRASIQNVNKSTGGAISTQGMRVVLRGRSTNFKMGTLKLGNLMDAAVTLSLTYLLIEMGGESKFELDKLNSVYKVNGKDLYEEIRKQC